MKKSILSLVALVLLANLFQGCCKEKIPYYAKVTKVVVKQFPTTNGSDPWDSNTSKADLYIRFWDYDTDFNGDPVMIYEFTSFIQNAAPTESYTFDLSGSALRFFPGLKYRLSLYDEDDASNQKTTWDFVEGIDFVAYEAEGEYTNPILLSKDGTVFEVHLEYVK